MVSWIELLCSLKSTTGCAGSGSVLVQFWYKSVSDVVYNWPWATCLELPYYSLFVAASTGPGCSWEWTAVHSVWLSAALR